MFAKISPTSPRGIIPRPIVTPLSLVPSAPSAQACFPSTAATVSSTPRPATSGRASAKVHPCAHQDEEDRHEERREWTHELLESVLAAFAKVAEVQLLEKKPGRVGADDRRQPEPRSCGGEREAKCERGGQQYAVSRNRLASQKRRGVTRVPANERERPRRGLTSEAVRVRRRSPTPSSHAGRSERGRVDRNACGE